MIPKTEQEERKYLEEIKGKLKDAITEIDDNIENYRKEVQAQKDYLWENKAGMDHVEKVSIRQSVTQSALTGEAAAERKKRLQKLMRSPYFGRVDFNENGTREANPIYIGIYAFFDSKANTNLVHDWRAPISSMFYDFEIGPAQYESPSGMIDGEIERKRQYRIRQGKMEYMLESSLNIHDDILQQELSKASDDKMKHIVATIQRDQNAIIRNETSQELIIQGVAGSGKTSIALHRIAFLLYRHRETISSKDILIISPNKVFADYISNVLPELGEEKIPEVGMEELAADLLENKYKFQSFFEQVTLLIEKNDENFRERINFKSSFEFITRLNEYLTYIENHFFVPEDLVVKRYPVPAWFIEERFRSYHRLPLFKRFNEVVKDIENNVNLYYKYEITGKERNQLRSSVKKMFKITNLRDLYKYFYVWMEKPELFKMAKNSRFEYADIFPLIYLKIKLEGIKSNQNVKHLLVDEMQDYSPVQYAVLARLFPCKKTILGDEHQRVNPESSSGAEKISRVFPGAESVKLLKSYRSTYEITSFAQKIIPDNELVAIERHGSRPEIVKGNNTADEIHLIKSSLNGFKENSHNSLGIICKTQKQARNLYEKLSEDFPDVFLLTQDTLSFSGGINICTVHMSKGLEFDQVIVPFATAENYKTEAERGLLYIACTRAMHHLVITHTNELTGFFN